MKNILFLFLLLLISTASYSQTWADYNNKSFKGNWFLKSEAGIRNSTFTDYTLKNFTWYARPDIDRSITAFKSDIESYLSNMLDDCCPMLEGKQKEDFIKDYVEQMYSDFEANFEDVRKTNEDMRKEADRQIDYAEEKLADAEEEIKDLNARIEELEGQFSELESQLDAVS